MGFLIRFIFAVGFIYALSPTHPGLPDWVEKSATAASIANSAAKSAQQVQSVTQTIASVCQNHPDACAKAANITTSVSVPQDDLIQLMEGLSKNSSMDFQPVVEMSNEPESTGSIAAHAPLPPRRTHEIPVSKKI